jgi:hypothetical protein
VNIVELSGDIDTASPYVQSGTTTNYFTSGAPHTLSVTLSAFSDANNMGMGFWFCDTGLTWDVATGFTELFDDNGTASNHRNCCHYKINDNVITADTNGNYKAVGLFALEFAYSAPAASSRPLLNGSLIR